MDRRTFFTVVLAAPAIGRLAGAAQKPSIPAAWRQWGGPSRNFHVEAAGLKDVWPSSGPPIVWARPLGDGYSAPSVEAGVLYTMYGRPREEVVIAVDAQTGSTRWEHRSPVTVLSDAAREMGNGPYAAPLIAGTRLFTAGVGGRLQSFDKVTGTLLWTQQLWTDHRGSTLMYGYSSSPIAFRDLVIVPVGGPGRALIAFRQADGKVAWARNDYGNTYSSPILISVGGLEQVVMLMDGAILGVNPHNGDLQWQVPFKADDSIAVATPLWGPDNLLFVSSEYGGGSKVVRLERHGLQTRATEVWTSNRLRLHHGNAIRVGDTIYFSNGGKGTQAILTAIDVHSGKVHWQARTIEKATFLWADNKLITLDQDGHLIIAHPSPQGFQITAKAPLLTRLSWTPPALVGTRLYLRDRRSLMAVELG